MDPRDYLKESVVLLDVIKNYFKSPVDFFMSLELAKESVVVGFGFTEVIEQIQSWPNNLYPYKCTYQRNLIFFLLLTSGRVYASDVSKAMESKGMISVPQEDVWVELHRANLLLCH